MWFLQILVFLVHCVNKIVALFMLIILFTNSYFWERSEFQPKAWKFSKNAQVDISPIVDGYISINAVQTSGHSTLMRFSYTNGSEPVPQGSLVKCALYTFCIVTKGINITTAHVDPEKEYMTLTRKFPAAMNQIKMRDCFQLKSDTQWMGGPANRHQLWPIQKSYFNNKAYVPSAEDNMLITERYWLTSRGMYIYVNSTAPIFIDQNNSKEKYLCFIIDKKEPYMHKGDLEVVYEIGWLNNSRLAHEFFIDRYRAKPKGRPDEQMIKYPIWSTWGKYKENINADIINNYADEIVKNGFNHSQLEIDDNWERCYGSAEFDPNKFKNVTEFVKGLKSKGFKISLWTHPFINDGCEPAHVNALVNNFSVRNDKGETTTKWWRGSNALIIDATNPNGMEWWTNNLKKLISLGIDNLKFVAGETSFLPKNPVLIGPIEYQPQIYTKSYVTRLAEIFNNSIEIRTGWNSQELPVFVSMIEKDSRYTWNNGLPTLITTLLQMNLAGYIYVLPDVIGGKSYCQDKTLCVSKDLFIRWLQATTFMPALKFSIPPWDYDNETITISKKYTELHAEITPTILKFMNNSITTGAPLNPPIWWVDPEDQEAHKVYDEFLLGDEILVAPVIEQDAIERDIYLPKGLWRNSNDEGIEYVGPLWLRNFPAPLDTLPYFFKIG